MLPSHFLRLPVLVRGIAPMQDRGECLRPAPPQPSTLLANDFHIEQSAPNVPSIISR